MWEVGQGANKAIHQQEGVGWNKWKVTWWRNTEKVFFMSPVLPNPPYDWPVSPPCQWEEVESYQIHSPVPNVQLAALGSNKPQNATLANVSRAFKESKIGQPIGLPDSPTDTQSDRQTIKQS